MQYALTIYKNISDTKLVFINTAIRVTFLVE